MAASAPQHRLLTIRISHYNEKARWALERFKVPYREHAYMPVLHMAPLAFANRRFSKPESESVASRFSTPVLLTSDGDRVRDSDNIVQWVNTRYARDESSLYPCAACGELEHRFGARIGPHSRRLAYHWALQDARACCKLAASNVGIVQSAAFCMLFPLIRSIIRRALKIDAVSAERSRDILLQEIEFANQQLGSQPYLVSDRFTAADLALACMLAPVLLVTREEGYGAVLPPISNVHPRAAEFAREIRATPAGGHAMRMFREQRKP